MASFACDVQVFSVLFASLLLFGLSFMGTLWNTATIIIVCASIWVLVYYFQGKTNASSNLVMQAIGDVHKAQDGCFVLVTTSWLLLLVNFGFVIYALVEKPKFIKWFRDADDTDTTQVNTKETAENLYRVLLLLMAAAIIMLSIFVYLGYDSIGCFDKTLQDLSYRFNNSGSSSGSSSGLSSDPFSGSSSDLSSGSSSVPSSGQPSGFFSGTR